MKITIIAKTENGKRALKEHHKEVSGNFAGSFALKRLGYSEELKGRVLTMRFENKATEFLKEQGQIKKLKDMVKIRKKTLVKCLSGMGAKKEIDYTMGVQI